MPETANIGLADAIAQLRAELSQARQQGQGQDIRFAMGDIEVEFSLEFGRTREGKLGFKLLSFLEAGGSAGSSDKSAHRIKLKLTIDDGGTPASNLITSTGSNVPHSQPHQGG
jgi:Trypsin-co-occurring domain 2